MQGPKTRADVERELAKAEVEIDQNLRRVLSQTPVTDALREDIHRTSLSLKQRASDLRRNLARVTGEEHAVWIDIGVKPEAGVSGAMLVQSESRCFVLFNASRPPINGRLAFAVVEFAGTVKTTLGLPADEAFRGHPLSERGLGADDSFEVLNSSWVAQEDRRNQTRFPDSRLSCMHDILTFHDSTVECLADAMHVAVESRPFHEVWQELSVKLNS